MDHRSVVCLIVVITIVIAILFLSTTSNYCNCTGMATSFDRAPYTFWKGAEYPFPNEARNNFDWMKTQQQLEQQNNTWPLHPELPYDKSGYQRLCTAYDPNANTVRDLIRDKQDGMIGLESTGEILRDKLASRSSAEEDALKPSGYKLNCNKSCGGSVSYVNGGALTERPDVWPSANVSKLVSLETVGGNLPPGTVEYNTVRYGNGKYNESSPIGTFRYGGYGTSIETNNVENAYGNVNKYYDLKVGVL